MVAISFRLVSVLFLLNFLITPAFAQPLYYIFHKGKYLDAEQVILDLYAPRNFFNLYGLLDDTEAEIGWPLNFISSESPTEEGSIVARLTGRRWCDGDECVLVFLRMKDGAWLETFKTTATRCLFRRHEPYVDEFGFGVDWIVGRNKGAAGFRYERGAYVEKISEVPSPICLDMPQ